MQILEDYAGRNKNIAKKEIKLLCFKDFSRIDKIKNSKT